MPYIWESVCANIAFDLCAKKLTISFSINSILSFLTKNEIKTKIPESVYQLPAWSAFRFGILIAMSWSEKVEKEFGFHKGILIRQIKMVGYEKCHQVLKKSNIVDSWMHHVTPLEIKDVYTSETCWMQMFPLRILSLKIDWLIINTTFESRIIYSEHECTVNMSTHHQFQCVFNMQINE